MSKIIDLTHTLSGLMPVHSYDEPARIEKIRNLAEHGYNDWQISSGMHTGTHIDGPGHITQSPLLLSSIPVKNFVGAGYLIDARDKSVVDASLVQNLPAEEDLIVLILTGSDKQFGTKEYFESHPVIAKDCAEVLAERKIKMVGIDWFSPDEHPFPVHKLFFDNNMLIIENLANLEQLLGVKKFTVVALPLKTETDSALARVIAIIDEA